VPISPQPVSNRWTVLEVIRWTTQRFEKHGVDNPRLDTELLASRAFALSRVELYTHFDRPLAEPELAAFRELVRRRLNGEPVAYLLGQKEFWSLDLKVDPRVLVPRPDTEALVEVALALLDEGQTDRPLVLADMGTGSGAIALAIKKERPNVNVWATDLSSEALNVARENADRLGLSINFVEGRLWEPLTSTARFDVLVSNPPYIPSSVIDTLSPEVRHEPRLALDGGPDGLELVRELITTSRGYLSPGGALAVEIGKGQAGLTSELFAAAGFYKIHSQSDLAGIPRVVSGRLGGGEP
jgi:release factor glutamine methyltransferase